MPFACNWAPSPTESSFLPSRYQQLLGCNNVTLTNTTSYYARYTTSVICNAIVQNSLRDCNLSGAAATPLCADSCAQQAISEEQILMNPALCGSPGPNAIPQIRADFTTCALPADSLSGSCIEAVANEPTECGFSGNLDGLCRYCGASSPNSTDSCCVGSKVNDRCRGVVLPSLAPMPTLFPSSTSSAAPSATAAVPASAGGNGLSGGAIAGIVIGSLVGAALLLGLIIAACVMFRRRRRGSSFGATGGPPRRSPPMATTAGAAGAGAATGRMSRDTQPAPGGRVARMAAIEGAQSSSEDKPRAGGAPGLPGSDSESAGVGGAAAGGRAQRREAGSRSSSSYLAIGGGATGGETDSSPNNQLSSPEGVQSAQSEQLGAFRDYYSVGDIHPGDRVATLWAYAPRAGDEFELERGDMLRVVGIWDDGWATGVRVAERAETWEEGRSGRAQRDSGVSNGSGRGGTAEEEREEVGTPVGEVKAFPVSSLVCSTRCGALPEPFRRI